MLVLNPYFDRFFAHRGSHASGDSRLSSEKWRTTNEGTRGFKATRMNETARSAAAATRESTAPSTEPEAEAVADVLDSLWGGPETLIVVSSDLSHYRSYNQACAIDGCTRRAIEGLDVDGIDDEAACGATPVRGLLVAARRHGLTVTTLDVRNSGDTAGDRDAVVGYGAWMFTEQ